MKREFLKTPWRWRLADWLSWLACKLRGHKWYLADTWCGVGGNRAAELKQALWELCVSKDGNDTKWLAKIEPALDELGQLAGENWGHKP